MALDRLEAIRAFCRIVELGSFSKASEVLGVAKTTISGQIQALEERLGMTLLHRSTRRVYPTTDGTAYYEQVKILLENFDDLENLIQDKSTLRGKIKIETTAPLGSNLLIPALPDFLQKYPEIRLEIRCSERAVDLIQEGVDCALRGGPVTEPDLVCKLVGQMRFCLCAAPRYLANAPELSHPRDLTQHQYIGFRFPVTDKLHTYTLKNGDEMYNVELAPYLTFNNADVYCSASLAGLGIIAMPRASVQRYFESGELVEVLPNWQTSSMPISIVYPYSRRLSARVRAFVDWATSLFENNPIWGKD
ncbi:LysR family transcriptional regulator [[Pasteurella] aerogenes]|nr:LysR family transcriptional regulator [[Pasteurella] aerogenes]MDY2797294.1 LysR family transcriptional regulator [[Pasteurella] aerogenes]